MFNKIYKNQAPNKLLSYSLQYLIFSILLWQFASIAIASFETNNSNNNYANCKKPYVSLKGEVCHLCPDGAEWHSPTSCKSCVWPYTSSLGSACQLNKCASGQEWHNGKCAACQVPYMSSAGEVCHLCPPDSKRISASKCEVCASDSRNVCDPSKEYLASNNTCKQCPVGAVCRCGSVVGCADGVSYNKSVGRCVTIHNVNVNAMNCKVTEGHNNDIVAFVRSIKLSDATIFSNQKNRAEIELRFYAEGCELNHDSVNILASYAQDYLKDKYHVEEAKLVKVSQGSIILTFIIKSTLPKPDIAAIKKALEKEALSLIGSVSSFTDHGTCTVGWNEQFTSSGSTKAGGNLALSKQAENFNLNGAFDVQVAHRRWCSTIKADAKHIDNLNLTSSGETKNKLASREYKGNVSFKYGLMNYKRSDDLLEYIFKGYSAYTFISVAQGYGVTEDTGAAAEKISSESRVIAAGIGVQGRGTICSAMDLSIGGYTGRATADDDATGISVDIATSGFAAVAVIKCPIPASKFYWDAQARYNSGEISSIMYGIGLGYKISDNINFQVTFENTKINFVTNRALDASFITTLW